MGEPVRRGTGDLGREAAIRRYRTYLRATGLDAAAVAELAGKDLACWCDPSQPCRADVLLQVANGGMTRREIFGRRVRQTRIGRGLSQVDLARGAGIHVTYLSGIERGLRNPSLDSIWRLADGLGVAGAELLALEEAEPHADTS